MVRAAVDRGTARTRHPDTVAIDAGVQVATAAVLLEEGIEGVEEHHVNIDLARYGLSSRRQDTQASEERSGCRERQSLRQEDEVFRVADEATGIEKIEGCDQTFEEGQLIYMWPSLSLASLKTRLNSEECQRATSPGNWAAWPSSYPCPN